MKRSKKPSKFKRSSENKKIRNATAMTLSDGTKFRSKLELFTYNKLIEAKIDNFKYEEEKFVLQEAFEFPNESIEAYERTMDKHKVKQFAAIDHKIRSMTYLPDFTQINEDKTRWILEVKGYGTDSFDLKWKLFKRHLIDNGYDVTLYKPNNQGNVLKCIEMIKSKYYG